jgi:hypothetical protein
MLTMSHSLLKIVIASGMGQTIEETQLQRYLAENVNSGHQHIHIVTALTMLLYFPMPQ